MSSDELIWAALKILAVLALVLLNGFFVAAEFALVKVRESQLLPLVAKGQRRAKVAQTTVKNLDAALSSTQLGITLASLGLGWIGEPVFVSLLEPVMKAFQIESPEAQHSIAFAIGFSVITFLHIVAGELAPKSLAIRKPVPTSLWVAIPLDWFYRLSFPVIWALNHTANWLLRRFGIEPISESELVYSEEELRLIVGGAGHDGEDLAGRDLVLNTLDLRRRIAREVMTPRRNIVGLNTEATIAECLDVAEKTRYSRFPLCEKGEIDRTLGVVLHKDLYAMRLKARTGADLIPIARKIIFVPETARLQKLLQRLLQRKLHFAMVVDEYGGTLGIVTLENILEEIVGPIQDEFDQEKPLQVRLSEVNWELDGALPVHDLEQLVGESLPRGDFATVTGYLTHQLGGFPKEGDILVVGNYELRVKDVDGVRVGRVELTRKPAVAV